MPYLRFTRDRRGYENTFLLHAAYPGERPRVLYWYRSAPDVRVGRAALDHEAIREIESAHPEILFDWSEILEMGAMAQPEVEQPRQPRKRPPPRPRDESRDRRPPHPPEPRPAPPAAAGGESVESAEAAETATDLDPATPDAWLAGASEAEVAVASEMESVFVHDVDSPPAAPTAGLLDELVGRGIATRLRGRYAELSARLAAHPADETTKEIWRVRLEALNPETWVTAEEVMAGMGRADALYDTLREEIVGPS
ncbi:MAG: hypothetical protein Q8L86_03225 [Vicinamibacterales bacterium]|nr:hypothetical protein [Vicinamibacterales bacterium]